MVPWPQWSAWRCNQSILKEISPGCSVEGLMLKLQYFGHLMWKADSLEKTLMLGKIEGGRRRGRQDEMAGWYRWLNGHEFEQAVGVGDGQGGLACCGPWGRRVRRDWATDLTPVMLDGSGIQTRVGEEILMDKSQGAVFLKPFRAAEGEERSPKGRVVVIYYSFLESLLTILWAR